MFDHLDPQARMIVDDGMVEARQLGHGWLGTEHVLLAALRNHGVLPPRAVALLPDAEQLRGDLGRTLARPAVPPSDEALLASLGIDLREVRRRATETFGPDAVQRAALRVRSRRRDVRERLRRARRAERKGHCSRELGDSLMVAARLKEAFERAHNRSAELGQPFVTAPVLLAAVLGLRGAVAVQILEARGVDIERVRAALDPN